MLFTMSQKQHVPQVGSKLRMSHFGRSHRSAASCGCPTLVAATGRQKNLEDWKCPTCKQAPRLKTPHKLGHSQFPFPECFVKVYWNLGLGGDVKLSKTDGSNPVECSAMEDGHRVARLQGRQRPLQLVSHDRTSLCMSTTYL